MKSIFLILLLLLGGSCATKQLQLGDLEKTHCWKGEFEGFGKLDLRSDKTFSYSYRIGLIVTDVEGSWNYNSKEIILNSEYQKDSLDQLSKIISTEKNNNQGFEIEAKDQNGQGVVLYTCVAYAQGKVVEKAVSNFDGYLKFSESKIDSIMVKQSLAKPKTFMVPDDINHIELQLFDGHLLMHYRYFSNEKWPINKKGILDPKWNQQYTLKDCN